MLAARKEDTPEIQAAKAELKRLADQFQIPEGMKIEDRMIPVDEAGTERGERKKK